MYTPKRASAVRAVKRENMQRFKTDVIKVTVLLIASYLISWEFVILG